VGGGEAGGGVPEGGAEQAAEKLGCVPPN